MAYVKQDCMDLRPMRDLLFKIAQMERRGKAVLVRTLALETKRSISTLHAQLNRLVEDGYVVDTPDSGGTRVVQMTERGREAARTLGSPLLGVVPAGLLRAPTECDGRDGEGGQLYRDTWDDLLPPTEDYCVLMVRGDSMKGDCLMEGDEVQLRRRRKDGRPLTLRDVRPGQIAAVMVGAEAEATLKHVFFDESTGMVTLKASNRKYRDIRVPVGEVRLVGTFRGSVRVDPDEVNQK